MKPTLLVLAAGMGSRYGGLKQLDGLGPEGQTIMDYSIYDALKSGFGRVVFVIRKDFEDQFRSTVLSRYEGHIPVEVVFQDINDLPEGYEAPIDRNRPWGTNHAVLAARDVIKEPFAVINSDDFYGRDAFRTLADFFKSVNTEVTGGYAMVAFKVGNTTSRHGEVSRGICTVDDENLLTKVVECHHIGYDAEDNIHGVRPDGENIQLHASTPVSMNFWGFTPDYFEYSMREFRRFLDKYVNEAKREFYIPSVVDKLIGNGQAKVEVLQTDSQWFGVTFSEDREGVCLKLKALHDSGEYPHDMF